MNADQRTQHRGVNHQTVQRGELCRAGEPFNPPASQSPTRGGPNAHRAENPSGGVGVLERPSHGGTGTKAITHLYHWPCNKDQETKTAFCGHKSPVTKSRDWKSDQAKSDDCTMCITARQHYGCPVCHHKEFD